MCAIDHLDISHATHTKKVKDLYCPPIKMHYGICANGLLCLAKADVLVEYRVNGLYSFFNKSRMKHLLSPNTLSYFFSPLFLVDQSEN